MLATTYDPGWVPLIAIVCVILTLASGANGIAKARVGSVKQGYAFLLHGFVILMVAAIGITIHFMLVSGLNAVRSMVGQFDPAQEAGDRAILARYDWWFSSIVAFGGLLGAIAILARTKRAQPADGHSR